MKNPLRKRLLPQLKEEIGKYIVIFLMMTLLIGFISGFLVADGSMIKAYDDGFEKYNIENGHFAVQTRLNRSQERDMEDFGVSLYRMFYTEQKFTNGSKIRIFSQREQVNTICLMEGAMPEQTGEIAIDRMYADNNGLSVGDTIENEQGKSYRISGLVAFPDYSCLFEDNEDAMFDAILFGVGIVTPETFAAYRTDSLTYQYAWKYHSEPVSEEQEKEISDEFQTYLNERIHLEEYVPRCENNAIQFTGDDMGKDQAMMTVLLYIFIVIMAFVFAITTKNTIIKEANVIGTLRASGYTRKELIVHYMTMPILVTFVSALIGNLLGYTVFKDICADMYYGSYSLPTYVTIWSAEAFWKTTLVPTVLMIVINFLVLWKNLRISPLKFIRRDLSTGKRKRAVRLSTKLPFLFRFRIRIILQNMSNYFMMFIGIIFANVLLMFGLCLPDIINDYADHVEAQMLANYQYMLKYPAEDQSKSKLENLADMLVFMNEVKTENETAEKFSAYTLKTLESVGKEEEVTMYGVCPDSRYVKIPVYTDKKVAVSSAYAEKYLLQEGDTITLNDDMEKEQYTFTVAQIYDYPGSLCVFMDRDVLNDTFGLGNGTFVGYFSDTEITDIDASCISQVIDLEALTKISRQLIVSMGEMMGLVDGIAVIVFVILIYLLSKIVIEKNGQSISMTKILGYSNREISGLYVSSTSIVVVTSVILSIPIVGAVMYYIYRMLMISSMNGWISFVIRPVVVVKMLLLGIGTYLIVAALEYRKVKRVPMDIALKNVE